MKIFIFLIYFSFSLSLSVYVLVAPEVRIPPPMRIGQVPGKETILECTVHAKPQGVTVWEKDGNTIKNGVKYGMV